MSEILVVLALVLANGLFSGAEIALLSVRRTRVDELVSQGRWGARWVYDLRARPESLLATVQVGITVVGSTAAAFGGAALSADLQRSLEPWLGSRAEPVSFVVVVGAISYLSLVLGELVPKSLALRHAETYALVVAPMLAALAFGARPLVWLLTTSSNLVLRWFGDQTSFVESRLSSEELRQLVDEAASAGTVDEDAGDIAGRALALSDLVVSDVMVPRSELITVPRDVTPEALATLTARVGHSRLLVHGADGDDLIGYVHVRDALAQVVRTGSGDLSAAIHAVSFVPTSLRATTLLRTLQSQRQPLAVAVDEAGTVRGLVTLEDLLEEIIGDLLSERERAREWIRPDGVGRWVVDASAPIRDVERELGLTLPEATNSTTLGGLVTERAQRIPEVGARLRLGSLEVEILEATRRKLKRVRLEHAPPSS